MKSQLTIKFRDYNIILKTAMTAEELDESLEGCKFINKMSMADFIKQISLQKVVRTVTHLDGEKKTELKEVAAVGDFSLEKDRINHNMKKYKEQSDKIRDLITKFEKTFDYKTGCPLKELSRYWNFIESQIYALKGVQNLISDLSKRQMLLDLKPLYSFFVKGYVTFEDRKVKILPPKELEEFKPWRGGYYYRVSSI